MLAYILGIIKQSNKGITDPNRFQKLKIGARGITNRDSLREFKSGQKDYESQQGYKTGQKRLQIGVKQSN